MKILILGGTGEARRLARRLVGLGHKVTSSLAGRTHAPRLPEGQVRIGGFGGSEGLADYLIREHIERLVDATHPYAARMSANAVAAAERTGVALVRLTRPEWEEPEGAGWVRVASPEAAARALPPGAAVLLTTGHGGLAAFLARADCRFVVRAIEPPEEPLPSHARLLLDRPPHGLEGELALMEREAITHLVSKNSGGGPVAAKFLAAMRLGVTALVIARPGVPPAREVRDIEAVVAALGGGHQGTGTV